MKTRELSMEEKQDIVKLKKEGKSIRAIAQTLGIANTTIWNVLKKQATTGVLTTRHRTGRPRKTTAVDDRNIVRAVKKNPQTTVSDITNNLHRAGVQVSQSTVRRRLREQKYRFHYISCKPLISSKKRKGGLEFAKNTEMRDEDLKEEQFAELWQQTECVYNVSSDLCQDRTKTDVTWKETEDELQGV
ncbi:hypothetical protein PDJAM_G00058690 [Pangasius djambal]|uniref:Uncharacterized protein n=1 Tax=Pangasius djambal TaxID=1691987 RepID=A0ACC5YXA6_9TELE|nr:hypothetical protein [Pangasius djambal]